MRVLVHVWQDKDGRLTGTVDSVDEDASGIAISAIRREKGTVHFEIASLGGVYDGKLDGDESTITGTWKQRDASLQLVLHRVRKQESGGRVLRQEAALLPVQSPGELGCLGCGAETA